MRIAIAFLLSLTAILQAQSPNEIEAVVTTEMGEFRIEFAPNKAPKHVEQFLKFTREGYYNGSAFFRAIANGMVQGGDPTLKDPATPRNRWGAGGLNLLPSEFSDMKHERGTVSTVNIPGQANSDGSQFFICLFPQPALDGKYTAFARVTEGLDVIERISRVPADNTTLMEKPVRIVSVKLAPKKTEPFLAATPEEMRRVVAIKTTLGTVRLQMEPTWAPENVRNFLKLASAGWFNGTAFHRIVKGFVAQGGTATSRTGSTAHNADRWVRNVKDEFRADVKHTRGVVSMAHFDQPNSADTSFFLMLGAADSLDGKYSAFARIIEGMEVLDAFEKEPVDGETPKRQIEILETMVE